MLRWYLVHTKPAGEALALTNLERQKYQVYFPRLLQTLRRSGRSHERIGPLFPRYLFVRLNEGLQALSPITFTVGVAGVVRFGSKYTIVPDQVVGDLQARADPETGLHHLSCRRPLTAGARVRILSGPFDGLEGVFERPSGEDRVIVLLNLLGRHSPVCVPADSLMVSHSA